MFIRYAPNQRGYKCYNPHTGKTHITMDVTFIKSQPFFSNKSLQGKNGEVSEEIKSPVLPTPLFESSKTPLPNLDVSRIGG